MEQSSLIEADSWTPPANANDAPIGVPNLVHFYEAAQHLQLDLEQVVPIHGRLTTLDDVRQAAETYGNARPWVK